MALALLVLLFLQTRRTPMVSGSSGTELTTETSPRQDARDTELAALLATDDVSAAEARDAGTGHEVPTGSVRVRRRSLDEWRANRGLPSYSPALIELDNFRAESPGEAADPTLHALYGIDREMYQKRLFAEHEAREKERFARDAESITDPQWISWFLEAAEDHGRLAEQHTVAMAALAKKRDGIVEESMSQAGQQ